MSNEKIEVTIDVNVFELIQKAYDEHFNRLNKIGCSDIPFCPRKFIISRLYNIPFQPNMKMLHGKIHHNVIQQPTVLKNLIGSICEQLDIRKNINVITEKHLISEIYPGKFMEGHIDIYTPEFIIEIKTTEKILKYWAKELLDYHLIQLNTYLGLEKINLGFILLLNLRAYFSDITNFNDVWKKYGCILPVQFNQELFDNTIEKAITMFKMMNQKKFNLAGPEFQWECKYCPKEIQQICMKERTNSIL